MINNAEIISSAKVTCIAAISDKNSRCIYAVLWSTLACCSNWIVPPGLFHFLLESANEQERVTFGKQLDVHSMDLDV